jgi:hypothetical protein
MRIKKPCPTLTQPKPTSTGPWNAPRCSSAFPAHLSRSLHSRVALSRPLSKKVDRRLLIILGALYAVSLIDRTNISVARVAGMAVELKLTVGERYRSVSLLLDRPEPTLTRDASYSIISAIFFAPYIVFELPYAALSLPSGDLISPELALHQIKHHSAQGRMSQPSHCHYHPLGR